MEKSEYKKQYELVIAMTYQESLKYFIKRAEERIVDWKQQLADFHKEKLTDEEYKNILRDGKNWDETWLKKLREELTYFNQGLNPPYCYPSYMRNKD